MVTFAQLRFGLEHSSTLDKAVSAKLPWPEDMKWSTTDEAAQQREVSRLPLLVAEGTGIYEPLGYKDNVLAAKGYVYSVPKVIFFL
jgi:hypothetical protein